MKPMKTIRTTLNFISRIINSTLYTRKTKKTKSLSLGFADTLHKMNLKKLDTLKSQCLIISRKLICKKEAELFNMIKLILRRDKVGLQ